MGWLKCGVRPFDRVLAPFMVSLKQAIVHRRETKNTKSPRRNRWRCIALTGFRVSFNVAERCVQAKRRRVSAGTTNRSREMQSRRKRRPLNFSTNCRSFQHISRPKITKNVGIWTTLGQLVVFREPSLWVGKNPVVQQLSFLKKWSSSKFNVSAGI